MATGDKAKGHDSPSARRLHSGLESLLPANILDIHRCAGSLPKENKPNSSPRPRPSATPQTSVSRSVSSMSGSFMLDHRGSASPNTARHEHDGDHAETPHPADEGAPAVIANWAHLSYLKSQRNTLRAELKAHQIAGAEAKRSVTSLRRLAFRMAVNISVKEKQIATTARNLAKSRTNSYLESKDAHKKFEQLQRALRVEEGRNKEILEALERASMLTLQYSNTEQDSRNASERSFPSPPPSPPMRSSDPDSQLGPPRTPTRVSPSPWHDVNWELTPRPASPSEIRLSDSRLIRAKRESDRALAACRSRIEQLQRECAMSKEDGRLLAMTRDGLEQQIRNYQFQIASLESSRKSMSDELKTTKSKLNTALNSEEKLQKGLQEKNEEIAGWEQKHADIHHTVDVLRQDKFDLEKRIQVQNTQIEELQVRTTTLEETLCALRSKLESTERHESTLQHRLAEKEDECKDLRQQLDREMGNVYDLEQKITTNNVEAAEHLRKIQIGGNVITTLHEQLKDSQNATENAQKTSADLREGIEALKKKLQTESDARASLAKELEHVQVAKTKLEDELLSTAALLEQETKAKAELQADLNSLRNAYDTVEANQQQAREQVRSLQGSNEVAQTRLETLRKEKAELEVDLKDVHQLLAQLHEEVQMKDTELARVESESADIQAKLQNSEQQTSSLKNELEQSRHLKREDDERHAAEMQKSDEHLRELEASILSLRSVLASSEKLESSLREELERVQSSKTMAEKELEEACQSKAGVESQLHDIQLQLVLTQNDRDSLQAKVDELDIALAERHRSTSSLGERLAATTAEGDILKNRISDLEAALKENQQSKEKLEKALSMAQSEGEASDANLADLRRQAGETEVIKDKLQKDLDETISRNLDLEGHIRSVKECLVKSESEARDVQAQLSNLQSETASLQQAKENVEKTLSGLQESHARLEKQLQLMQSQLYDTQSKVSQFESKLASNEEELEAMCRAKAAVEKRLEQTHNENSRLEAELAQAQESNKALKSHLDSTISLNGGLENNLTVARAETEQAHVRNSTLESKLSNAERELENYRQLKSSLEARLSEALEVSAGTEQSLSDTRSRLHEIESKNAALFQELRETKEELGTLQQDKIELEAKADNSKSDAETFEKDLSSMRSRVAELDVHSANLASQLSANEKELNALRLAHNKLGESSQVTSNRTNELEAELRAVQMRLEIAESKSLEAITKLFAADRELNSLQDTRAKLEASEKDILNRLSVAEDELNIAREKNAALEVFLERVQSDMANAYSAVEETERRCKEFVEGSEAKLKAADECKLRYKRKLHEKSNELEHLINENSNLHQQIGIQTREMGDLMKSKNKLVQELSNKDKYIKDLGSSAGQRMRSMNAAYNDLKKKFEEQQHRHEQMGYNHDSAARLEAELERKMTQIEEIQNEREAYAASFAALEQEVEALRNDKRAFEKLVSTLKEKIRHLEVLEEWEQPGDIHPSGSPRHITIEDEPYDTAPSSPISLHARSSIGPSSTQHERPETRSSTVSHEEDLDMWARHVEQVRIQRDEAALQLKGIKKSQHNLKKTLRNTDAQLHKLEKESKTKRHPNLLRKRSRPMTTSTTTSHSSPSSSPRIGGPTRPRTSSHGFSLFPHSTTHTRHSIHLPHLHTEDDKATPERPKTSHTFGSRLGSGRRTVSVGDELTASSRAGGHRKKWGLGLRGLFLRDS